MNIAWLMGALLAGPAGAERPVPPLSFEFRLEDRDRAAFEDPERRGAGSGTPALVRLRNADPDRVRLPARVDVFQEGAERFPRWRWVDGAIAREGDAPLTAASGHLSILVWRQAGTDGSRISTVIRWPSEEHTLEVAAAPVRVLTGTDPGAAQGEFQFLSGGGTFDPLCESSPAGRWQCIAVPALVHGVLALCSPGRRTSFAEVVPGGSAETGLRPDGWAAAVRIGENPAGETGQTSPVTFSLLSPAGAGGQTLDVRPIPAIPLGESVYWLHAPLVPDAWVSARHLRGSGRSPLSELSRAACGEPILMALQPVRVVHGMVIDSSRKPIAGASVLALEKRNGTGGGDEEKSPVLAASGMTDEQGSYAFGDLEPSVTRLRACHPRTGCAEKELGPDTDTVDFSLAPRWRFTGRTISRAGVPAADAHLRFVPLMDDYAHAADRLLLVPPETDAVTDPSGHFEISAPAPARYFLEARAPGLGTARKRIDVTALTPASTDLGEVVLKGSGEFLGRLVGAGCMGGALSLLGPVDFGGVAGIREFPIDTAGLATVELPEGGTWLVRARCADGLRIVNPEVLTGVEDLYGQEVRFVLGARQENPAKPSD